MSWLRFASVLGVLVAFGCDGNVLVGYGTDASMPKPSPSDAGNKPTAPAQDSGVKVKPPDAAPVDTAHRDAATTDASEPEDAAIDSGPVDVPPAAVSWKSGVHSGNEVQGYVDFGTWRGRDIDIAAVYPERKSWAGIVSPGWPVDMFAAFPGRLLLSLPLYPEGMGDNQTCAKGDYDDDWKALGTFLVNKNREDTILRLGWGFNDSTHPWKADADPSDWIACFRHVVTAVRSTAPEVAIDWSFNPHGNPEIMDGDPYAAYPGDEYVDFVGLEEFDTYPSTHDAAAWNVRCHSATGLCTLAEFARAHGKKLGIGEWGGVACGDDPGGDNPFFIRKIFDTFAENADVMGFEAYFEDGDADLCSVLKDSDKNTAAAAEYQELYGPR